MGKLLTLMLGFSLLAGCSTQSPTVSSSSRIVTSSQQTEESTEDENTLVVYFSATGHTEKVAEVIANEMNADTFEITPAQAYTSEDLNWSNSDSRVSREHEDESLQEVELTTTKVDNWDSITTVFIGYPIWWGNAAWPVTAFVKANDFTGKTVIPFATSASSGIGESGAELEKAAGNGNWKEGHRFSSSVSDEEVRNWLSELN